MKWKLVLLTLVAWSSPLTAQTSATYVGDTLVVKVWRVQPVPFVVPPPVDTTPKPPLVPPSGSVVFRADWSTATGNGQSALRDLSKPLPFDVCEGQIGGLGGDILYVVPATGLGFPPAMKNVLRVKRSNIDSWAFCRIGATSAALIPHWPQLAIGQANYWRVYLRNDIPDSEGEIPLGPLSHHPIQMPHNSSGFEPTNFFSNANGTMDWEAYTLAPNNAFPWDKAVLGTYVGGNAYGATLPKFTVLRFEWMFRRDSNTGYSMAIRIYDDHDVLLWSEDGVGASKGTVMNERGSGQASLKSHDGLYAADPVTLQSLGIGENGGWHSYSQNVYFYFGGLAMCTRWCGPYVGDN